MLSKQAYECIAAPVATFVARFSFLWAGAAMLTVVEAASGAIGCAESPTFTMGNDCNGNGVDDATDIASGTSADCDGNGIPDECQIDQSSVAPGGPFFCDPAAPPSGLASCDPDCNGNGIPDGCEPDADGDGVIDACDNCPNDPAKIDPGFCGCSDNPRDCSDTIVCTADTCVDDPADPAGGRCEHDGTGVTDLCDDGNTCTLDDICQGDVAGTCEGTPVFVEAPQQPEGEAGFDKNRYVSFSAGNAGQRTAVRLTIVDMPPPHAGLIGSTGWVGMPAETSENAGKVNPSAGFPNFRSATLRCTPLFMDWSETGPVHVYHKSVVPGGTYWFQVIDERCDAAVESNYTAPLIVTTSRSGDVTRPFDPATGTWPPPDGSVDIPFDCVAIMDKFSNLPTAMIKARADVDPATPDQLINVTDTVVCIDAFRGLPYPFTVAPISCP